jgi:hypothetical protein
LDTPDLGLNQTFKRLTPGVSVRALPSALVLLLALRLAWSARGSIDAANWLSTGILVCLIAAAALASGAARVPGRAALAGASALILLAAWDFASLTWSAVPQLARDEALLTALYAVALLLPTLTFRDRADRDTLLGVVVVGLGALVVATGVELWTTGNPLGSYWDGRLAFPVSYPNANAALFLLGFWPAVALAARATAPLALRAAALGSAAGVLGAWLAAQSKGGGIALALSAVVFFAVTRDRLRALAPTALAAVAAGAAWSPLTAPFRASDATAPAAIRHTGIVLLLVCAFGVAAGAVYALIDRRVNVPAQTRQALGTALLAALVAITAGCVAIFFVRVDDPTSFLSDKWHVFKTLPADEEHATSTHLFTLGSNRYDFWRVALHELERNPVAGAGARGFGPAYLIERRSAETPQRAHSIELDALGETGLVGFALLVAGIGIPLTLVARRARSSLEGAAILAAAAYWIVHASGDWIWTFPSVTLVFMLLLGAGVAGGDRPVGSRAAPVAAAAAALLALVFAAPWLSIRYANHALATNDPAGLTWARRLDPLSVDPYLAEATLNGTKGAVAPLQRAVEKQPRRAELHYRLGLALLDAGRKADARRELSEAVRLDPRDDLPRAALERAR